MSIASFVVKKNNNKHTKKKNSNKVGSGKIAGIERCVVFPFRHISVRAMCARPIPHNARPKPHAELEISLR